MTTGTGEYLIIGTPPPVRPSKRRIGGIGSEKKSEGESLDPPSDSVIPANAAVFVIPAKAGIHFIH
ncbi:hypothetical protein V22_32050 [Calycomorphotria hydatis]|uniref:Uncharacterized protein n=1 Tax=Calycomorphotria hydatis TaxID=2528027 RepID=A0A517TC41_9PLAN|nr:hypothetical protein V22_32050 [Calycomorphotria hydatis]